jgi:hypothetical protein
LSGQKLGSNNFKGGVAKFQVTDRYFRAIAKIGLHYFLSQFPIFSGTEEIFANIRSFIVDETGGALTEKINHFLNARTSPLFEANCGQTIRSHGWMGHLLCAEIRNGMCLAYFEPFISQYGKLTARTIFLGRGSGLGNDALKAHFHFYYRRGETRRFAGSALDVPPILVDVGDDKLAPQFVSGGGESTMPEPGTTEFAQFLKHGIKTTNISNSWN